jgi:beta-lactamase class A
MIKTPTFKCLMFLLSQIVFISTCFANTQQINLTAIQKKLANIEVSSGARIGLFAINTADNTIIKYRAKERFPMCSTSKVMCVSAILKKSMMNSDLLQQKIRYTNKEVDSSGYAPMTKNHIADGMTIAELCNASITHSDNMAMNLLLNNLGGPNAVTRFARSIGDKKYRLDRYEPDLNSAIPGDLRDTTTPEATAKGLYQLVLGDVLASSQREQLQLWLKTNTTGKDRIRAGVPKGWVVGDKTGTGDYGTTNDIGILWPPKKSPIIVVIYVTQNKKDATPRGDIIASVTRILITMVTDNQRSL